MKLNTGFLMMELARQCMTLRDLSAQSGVNAATLTRIKTGVQDPQPATIGKIAKALNVNVETLILGS